MTQTVKGPDGRIHKFPDGVTPQQIQAAMRQTYNIQSQQQAAPKPQDFGFTEQNAGGLEGQISGNGKAELAGNSLAQGRVLNALQGATFNFADEVLPYTTAGLDEVQRLVTGKLPGGANVPFDQRVDYYRNQARALGDRMMQERPVESVATQIGGGIISGGGLLTGAANKAIGAVAPGTANALRAGSASLGARAAQGSVAAGIGGGVAGVGGGTDTESRIAGGVIGTAVGAPLGAVLPLATSGLGAIGRGIQSAILPGTVNADRRAAEVLGQAVGRSQLGQQAATPQQALTAMQQSGISNATLADLSDELTSLAGAVARSPGRGKQIISDFLRARQEGNPVLGEAGGGQWVDMLNDIASKISPSVSAKQATAAMVKARSNAADPLYEAARQVGTVSSDELSRLASIPTMKSALQRGINMAKQEGTLPPDFKLDPSKPLTVDVWHQAKVAIDDLIGSATRDGNKAQARSLLTMQQRLLDELDTSTNGLYGIARNKFAGDSAVINAIETGKNILTRSTTAEDIAEQVGKFTSQSEIESFRAGAAQALRDTVMRVGRKGNAAGKFLNRPDIQQKIRALFGNDAEYQDFMQRIQGRDRMYRTYSELGNSQTQPRMAAEADLESSITGGAAPENILTAAAVGGRAGAARNIMQRLSDGPVRFLSEKVRTRIAEMLTSSDPAKVREAARMIQDAARSVQGRQLSSNAARVGAVQGLAIQPLTSGE